MKVREHKVRSARHDHMFRRAAGVVVALAWSCSASVAQAANWEFLPRIEIGGLVDDNYTLVPESGRVFEVAGGQIDAVLALRATTPLTEFTLAPRLASTYLPGDEEWESDDTFVRLDWRHQRQRLTVGLRGDYSDVSTRRSELPFSDVDGDLGDPDGGDTGVVSLRNRRERIGVAPSLSFDVTQRSTILMNAGYEDVQYDQGISGESVSYSDTSASIGYGFRTSPTSNLTLSGTASRYEREIDSIETDSYGVRVDWVSRLSEVARWYLRVGAEDVDVPESLVGTGASGSETAFDGGVGADWSFKVTTLFIDATASVEPNGSGRLIQREQLRLRLTRHFGPRLTGTLGARASRDTAVADDAVTFRDRDYATGSLGLQWRLTREFSLEGRYDLTWQDREDSTSDATANAFLLSIVYERQRSD